MPTRTGWWSSSRVANHAVPSAGGRAHDHVRPLGDGHRGEPPTDGAGLLLAARRQPHVRVPLGDVDDVEPGGLGVGPREVAGALTGPDHAIRPGSVTRQYPPGSGALEPTP